MQVISKPASNTIVSIAESRTLSGLTKLVGVGDVACNADTEVPPSSGHSSVYQLEVYTLPTAISVVSLPRTVQRLKARRRRRLPLNENIIVISPISSSSS